jgi:hypothetical protein
MGPHYQASCNPTSGPFAWHYQQGQLRCAPSPSPISSGLETDFDGVMISYSKFNFLRTLNFKFTILYYTNAKLSSNYFVSKMNNTIYNFSNEKEMFP